MRWSAMEPETADVPLSRLTWVRSTWKARGKWFTLRALLLSVAGIAVVLGVALKMLDWRDRRHCEQRLHQVRAFLANHNDHFGAAPPAFVTDAAGNPLNSWRWQLERYFDFDWDGTIQWDSPRGRALQNPWKHGGYSCPLSHRPRRHASFVALTGPGTAFEPLTMPTPYQPLSGTVFAATTTPDLDSLPHDLILIVEVRNSGIEFKEPRDFDIRTMARGINTDPVRGISSHHPGGAHVLFADGQVWFIHNDAPFDELEKLFTIEGANKHDRDALLRGWHD